MTATAKAVGKQHGSLYLARIVLILLATAWMAYGQLPTATILGVVKDSSGAVVPDVALTARNVSTGQTRSSTSAADGAYRFAALPVGSYEVRVEHAGFRGTVRTGLTLAVGEEAVVNFTLEVGSIEQTVEVSAQAPLVNTTSGSLGSLVNEQRVADLPLNGRNYIDLTLLQPGVQLHVNRGLAIPEVGSWIIVNGAPPRSNNYLLDGASMTTTFGATSGSASNSTLGIEGIREYRVITNAFSAEYGMTMGSQMIIASKGGTNSFHGSAFEYLRNSALDARNFFDYKTATNPSRIPPFKRNQFGGSFGGPIKKDRTFFFGVYEGLRERLGTTRVSKTIPVAARQDGGLVPQIAPVIRPILPLFAVPNLPGDFFTFPFNQATNESYGQMRVDQNFSAKDTTFVRYTIDDTTRAQPLNWPQFADQVATRAQYLTWAENHVFSPTLLNTARFSFSRTHLIYDSPSGIIGPQFSFLPGKELGNINIVGLTAFGPDQTSPSVHTQNVFAYSDDLFYTHGRHSLKFGALINHYQQYVLTGTFSRAAVNFAALSTFLLGQPSSYQAATPGSILDRFFHYNTLGFYGQDDVRVSSKLTINIGLRYEIITVPVEVNGHGSAIRDIQHDAAFTLGPPFRNPSLLNLSPRFGFAWDVKGDGKTAVRGGFAELYDVGNWGGAFIVGANASPPFSSSSTVQAPPPPQPPVVLTLPLSFPASAVGKSPRPSDYNMSQPHMLQFNLTVEQQLPADIALSVSYAGSRGFNLMQVQEGNPLVPQGIGVGGVCVNASLAPASANGPKCWTGTDLRTNRNWSSTEFHSAGGASWYNALEVSLTKRLTKGLQFQGSYTWSKLMDDTQGEVEGENNSSSTFASYPQNVFLDWAPSTFDLTHNLRFNAIYRLPSPAASSRLVKYLLGGWWTSGVLSMQTGYPFSAVLGSNRSRSGVKAGTALVDRPDLVPGRSNKNITSGTTAGCQGVAQGQKLGTPNLYFDPCGFTIPAAGFLGTAGRDILRGPGLANLDFSLVKDTAIKPLGEAAKLEFRAEFFNLLNRANFITPGIGQTNANGAGIVYSARADREAPLNTAGVLTQTAVPSRQIQFALKLIF